MMWPKTCGELMPEHLLELNKTLQRRGSLVTKNWKTNQAILKHPHAVTDIDFDPDCPTSEIMEAFQALEELHNEEK
jgi:hypothetical protein